LSCCEATATSRYVEIARVQAIKVFRLAVWPQIKKFLPLARSSRRLVKKAQSKDCACERINTKINSKNNNKGKVKPHFPSIFEFSF
jgi:hypothetical protein